MLADLSGATALAAAADIVRAGVGRVPGARCAHLDAARVRKRLRAQPHAPAVTAAKVAKVEQDIANLTDAIAGGLLRSSPAIAERLHAAEKELPRLRAVRPAPEQQSVEKLITGLEAGFARLLGDFERALRERHAERGRQALRDLLGEFKVEADAREIRFYNEQGRHEAALLRVVGADARNCGSGGTIWYIPTPPEIDQGLTQRRPHAVREVEQRPTA